VLTRSTSEFLPFEAGQSFYDRAKRAVEAGTRPRRSLRGADTSQTAQLWISAAGAFARLLDIPHLTAATDEDSRYQRWGRGRLTAPTPQTCCR